MIDSLSEVTVLVATFHVNTVGYCCLSPFLHLGVTLLKRIKNGEYFQERLTLFYTFHRMIQQISKVNAQSKYHTTFVKLDTVSEWCSLYSTLIFKAHSLVLY